MSSVNTSAGSVTTFFGSASVSPKGQIYLPAPAREHLGLDGGGAVLVFGQRGRVVLTTVEFPDELLEVAAEHTATAKTTRDSSGPAP
jgi:AbrB family looped-hinge helix DNA binding protein